MFVQTQHDSVTEVTWASSAKYVFSSQGFITEAVQLCMCCIMLQRVFCAGQPDKAGTPLLMAMHQQQAHLRAASLPSSPSLPRSASLPQQQPVHQPSQPQQQAAPQSSQQEQGQQAGRLQQAGCSPLDPAFKLLPDAEKNRRMREFLLGVKPNLQPVDLNQLLQTSGHGAMSAQVRPNLVCM